MASINVGNADDRAYIREHKETVESLRRKNQELAGLQARVVKKTAIRDAVAFRVQAGLERQNSVAKTALGNFYNLHVVDHLNDEDDPQDTMELLSDADANLAQGI